jgi:hypothetical protein
MTITFGSIRRAQIKVTNADNPRQRLFQGNDYTSPVFEYDSFRQILSETIIKQLGRRPKRQNIPPLNLLTDFVKYDDSRMSPYYRNPILWAIDDNVSPTATKLGKIRNLAHSHKAVLSEAAFTKRQMLELYGTPIADMDDIVRPTDPKKRETIERLERLASCSRKNLAQWKRDEHDLFIQFREENPDWTYHKAQQNARQIMDNVTNGLYSIHEDIKNRLRHKAERSRVALQRNEPQGPPILVSANVSPSTGRVDYTVNRLIDGRPPIKGIIPKIDL